MNSKLVGDRNNLAAEFIEGMVLTYTGLKYLDGFPKIKVVLRADVSSSTFDKVSIISGGGSGHEPAHAGFVGIGMLSAAICGDFFASPPVGSILAGIKAVTGSKGCLLIVQNYKDNELNFELAAEQAKSEGFEVEIVIVGDDCNIPPPRDIARQVGFAGTILVHKVAGAAADAGLSLANVAAKAKRASEMVRTMTYTLSMRTLPGEVTSDRLGPVLMDFGLGIHGEPEAIVTEPHPVDAVVSRMLMPLLSTEAENVPIKRGSSVVLMINGLGGTPLMELMSAAENAVRQLQLEHGVSVDRVYTGNFMTILDMKGFSISIMKADQSILQYLDAPTKAPFWIVGAKGNDRQTKLSVRRSLSIRKKKNVDVKKENKAKGTTICALHLRDSLIVAVDSRIIGYGPSWRDATYATIDDLGDRISNIDERVWIFWSGFQSQTSDLIKQLNIEYNNFFSEQHVGHLMEFLCDRIEDYVHENGSSVTFHENYFNSSLCVLYLPEREMVKIDFTGTECTFDERSIVYAGSGGDAAREVLSEINVNELESSAGIEIVIRAMSRAAELDQFTGGRCRVFCYEFESDMFNLSDYPLISIRTGFCMDDIETKSYYAYRQLENYYQQESGAEKRERFITEHLNEGSSKKNKIESCP